MPMLETDFTDVPDSIPVLEPGTYHFNIIKVEFRDGGDTPQKGQKMASYSFQLQVNEGAQKGKTVFDEFPAAWLKDKQSSTAIKFKHLLQSAGVSLAGGVDTDSLVGKSVQGIVKNSNYTSNNETKVKAEVKEYIYSK